MSPLKGEYDLGEESLFCHRVCSQNFKKNDTKGKEVKHDQNSLTALLDDLVFRTVCYWGVGKTIFEVKKGC